MSKTSSKKNRPGCGAHMSIAGGMYRAFEAGQKAGCDCMQVFVKNQRRWGGKPLTDQEIAQWNKAGRQSGIKPVVAHATYLINLGTADATLWEKSVSALVDELTRCESLSIRHLVLHPGSHKDQTFDKGLVNIVKGIDETHRRTAGLKAGLLLETTAGQGSSIGYLFEHLASIIDRAKDGNRLGVCVDTCHIFAAGYPLSKPAEYESSLQQLEDVIGLKLVKCVHLNDSKNDLGSRVDRHEHIGRGRIGLDGFRNLLNDSRFDSVPLILETPKGTDARGRDFDVLNLKKLRSLIR